MFNKINRFLEKIETESDKAKFRILTRTGTNEEIIKKIHQKISNTKNDEKKEEFKQIFREIFL